MTVLRGSRALRAVVVAVVLAAASTLLWQRGPNWGQVADSFRQVQWIWIGAAVALNLVSVLVRAACWWAILRQAVPRPALGYPLVLSGYAVGLLANAVLPGRVGEVARVAVLRRRTSARRGLWPTLIGTVVAHRLFDLPPSAALAVWVMVAGRMPTWAFDSLFGVLVVGAAALAGAVAVARRPAASAAVDALGRIPIALRHARTGLAVLRAPQTSVLAATTQVSGWLCQLFAVWGVMNAFSIHLPIVAAGLVLALMNVANLLPLWPGNVGLVQAAVALPLLSYGVRYAHGFAFGVGLQAVEASVGVGYGLGFALKEGIGFAAVRAPTP